MFGVLSGFGKYLDGVSMRTVVLGLALLLPLAAPAQRRGTVSHGGIPCGNSYIAPGKVCHIGAAAVKDSTRPDSAHPGPTPAAPAPTIAAAVQAMPATFDSAYVIPARAGVDASDAYARVAAALVGQGLAITQALPGLALTAVATENSGITVHVSIAGDGMAYLSAQVMVGNPGAGAQYLAAAERGSRAGGAAWARLQKLAAAITAGQ